MGLLLHKKWFHGLSRLMTGVLDVVFQVSEWSGMVGARRGRADGEVWDLVGGHRGLVLLT